MAQATTRLTNGDDKIGSFSCIFIYIRSNSVDCWLLSTMNYLLDCVCVRCSLVVVLVHLYGVYLPFHAYEPRRPFVHLCNIVRLLRHDRYMNMLFRCVSRLPDTNARARAAKKWVWRKTELYLFHHLSILNYLLTSAHEHNSPCDIYASIPSRQLAIDTESKQLQKAKDGNKIKSTASEMACRNCTHSHDNDDAGDDTAFRIQCLTAATTAVGISRIHREIMFSV